MRTREGREAEPPWLGLIGESVNMLEATESRARDVLQQGVTIEGLSTVAAAPFFPLGKKRKHINMSTFNYQVERILYHSKIGACVADKKSITQRDA